VEDPERYLNELGVTVPSLFDSSRTAVLDADHRVRVNHDTFFFADDGEKARFLADPGRSAPFLADPVSGAVFHPGPRTPRRESGGRLYLFAGDSTLALFDAAPDSFAIPRLRMMPMDGDP
jgi:YHS domain-containing protein